MDKGCWKWPPRETSGSAAPRTPSSVAVFRLAARSWTRGSLESPSPYRRSCSAMVLRTGIRTLTSISSPALARCSTWALLPHRARDPDGARAEGRRVGAHHVPQAYDHERTSRGDHHHGEHADPHRWRDGLREWRRGDPGYHLRRLGGVSGQDRPLRYRRYPEPP